MTTWLEFTALLWSLCQHDIWLVSLCQGPRIVVRFSQLFVSIFFPLQFASAMNSSSSPCRCGFGLYLFGVCFLLSSQIQPYANDVRFCTGYPRALTLAVVEHLGIVHEVAVLMVHFCTRRWYSVYKLERLVLTGCLLLRKDWNQFLWELFCTCPPQKLHLRHREALFSQHKIDPWLWSVWPWLTSWEQ